MNNTLIKGLRLLDLLARAGEPMGLVRLAEAAGMPKSSAHRLLGALVSEHYVLHEESGDYAPSIKLWSLASSVLAGFDLRRQADPVMEALMQQTGETVHLSVLDHCDVVYVHKVEGLQPVRAYTQIGGRAPAHCVATGKAMMAFKDVRWLNAAMQHLQPATPATLTQPQAFQAAMQRVQVDGFAINQGEWQAGVNGLAAPIFDDTGSVIAAIGISGPNERLNLEKCLALKDRVCEAAQELSLNVCKAAPHASLLAATARWAQSSS